MRQTGQLYGREAIGSLQLFLLSIGPAEQNGFSELCLFLFGAICVPVRPEITHRLPTKRDAKPLKKYAAATRLRACSQLRVTRE